MARSRFVQARDDDDGVPKLRLPMRAAPLSYLRFPLALGGVRQRGGSGRIERAGQPRQDRQVSVKLDPLKPPHS